MAGRRLEQDAWTGLADQSRSAWWTIRDEGELGSGSAFRAKGVGGPEPSKLREVPIPGYQKRVVFDGEGSEMGVHHQLSRRAGVIEELSEDRPMMLSSLQEMDCGLGEPIIDNCDGFPDRKRFLEDFTIRGDSKKGQDRRPGKPDRFGA